MNRLNIPTIKQQQSEGIFLKDSPLFCLKDTHSRFKYTNKFESKRMEKYIHSSSKQKRALKWQPTPVFLPGESQGQGSLVGCHLWGHTQSDTTETT